MSVDHALFSKNTGKELLFFENNYFVLFSFANIVRNFANTIRSEGSERHEISKSDLEDAVSEILTCLNRLYDENNPITTETVEQISSSEEEVLYLSGSSKVFAELIRRFKLPVLMYLEEVMSLKHASCYIFYKFFDAALKLRELLDTFDFENDTLLIEQSE